MLKSYRTAERMLNKIAIRQIGEFAYVTDGIHESIAFDETSGINLISAKAPKNNFFDLNSTGHISHMQNSLNPRTQLRDNDVIISTVGTIGNCAVVNKRILPANADRHVGIIRINNFTNMKPRYLSTFILTKYGRYQSVRFTTGNVQPNLFIYKVKEIKVPLLSNEFQDNIEQTVLYAESLLARADEIVLEAENNLNSLLGVKAFTETACSVKSLSSSFIQSGRLDAEYYQPKYDLIQEIIKRYPNKLLKELAVVNTGEFVEEKYYGDNGIDYIRGTDITNTVVDNSSAVKVNINISDLKKISYGDLAFAMIGSVGNVSIYKSSSIGIVSNNLGTISPFDKKLSNYILLFLTSKIGQMLFEKYQTRTAQPKIRKEDVENFPILLLDDETIKNLSDKLDESFRLRKEAKRLLDNAIKAVEIAIETNEETALQWLINANDGESYTDTTIVYNQFH